MTTPTPPQNSRYSERSEEPYAKRSDLQESRTDDLFNDGLERLLAGDISGLDDIEPELRDTVLEITGLAHTAGWLTPSAGNAVSVDEGKHTESYHVAPPALHGHVPRRTTNRATGPQEVTMQATAIPATPPISHRTRERSKPAITPATRFPFPGIANAAVVVLLILAGFGSWRVFEGGMIGGGDGPVPAVRHHAQAPLATAEPGKAPLACDFSEEVPVYNGVDEPPSNGTVIYVTTSHELMIRCDEEPEDVLLAQDVDSASPTGWPGVLLVAGSGSGNALPKHLLLNLLASESVEFTFTNPGMTKVGDWGFTSRSPFIATAVAGKPSVWMLTDQRSMESRTLSDLGRVEWPRNASIYISHNGQEGTYAIAVHDRARAPITGSVLSQPEGFPGEILLISGSLNNVSWIDIPDDIVAPISLEISPDGRHVAALGLSDPETPERATISVLRTSDGAEVARTDTFDYDELPNTFWVNDGEALVYPQSGAVMMLEAEEGSAPQLLLESGDRLFALSATYDADIVTISESSAPETGWKGESDRVHAINTRTGSVKTFEGQVWRPGAIGVNAWHVQSVLILIDPEEGESGTTRVIDPSTGDELLRVPYVPAEDDAAPGTYRNAFPADTLAVSADRGTTAFTIRDQRILIVANVSAEGAMAREVPFPEFTSPERAWSAQVHVSPGGSTVQFTAYTDQMNMQWTLDLTDPDATWQKIPEDVWVDVMPAMP